MTRIRSFVVSGAVILLALSPAIAQPRHRGLGRMLAGRLLSSLSAEQKAQLREIGRDFAVEARKHAPSMREAGRVFAAALESQWDALSEEQRAKGHEFVREMRSAPPHVKLGTAMRMLQHVDLAAVADDIEAWIGAENAAQRVAAEEKLIWHGAKAVGALLVEELDLTADQMEFLRVSLVSVLDTTRADRTAVHAIAREKLAQAAEVLTDEQLAEIEKLGARVLAFCRSMRR